MSLTTTTVLAVLLMATTLSAQGRDLQPRQEAADILSLALQTRDEPGVRQAARVAAARLPEDSRLRRMLQSTADTPTIENDRLMTRLASIRDDLAFKPVLEASVPTGFPAVAPVGEIVLSERPQAARAS